MEEETTVSQETVETPAEETATPSVSEEQPALETETAPADVSDQPEKKPRSEQRIHELSKRLKESEQRADYWERLNATPPVPPTDEPQEVYSAEQIGDVILRKQQTAEIERQKVEANKELQVDITQTLIKHPDLESNDKLSKTIFAYAQANGMRISDAADEIKSQIKSGEEKARKEMLATQSGRIGVTTPSGGRVSDGADKINIDSMSEEEKAANWGKILQSYQK